MSPALDLAPAPTATTEVLNLKLEAQRTVAAATAGVYYNARLDPANYMDGPLSCNPATRLRQMLARPGIIVGTLLAISRYVAHWTSLSVDCAWDLRWYQCTMRHRSRFRVPVPKVSSIASILRCP
jgi:hypothetical protein